jgi:hypothetical protein
MPLLIIGRKDATVPLRLTIQLAALVDNVSFIVPTLERGNDENHCHFCETQSGQSSVAPSQPV